MKVFVYFNLHRKCWSVKALEGDRKGRVVAHKDFIVLRDAKGKVSQAGRERVLREKRKNVHAGVVGYWDDVEIEYSKQEYVPIMVTYNPYKYDCFVDRDTEQPWEGSEVVLMNASTKDKIMAFV